MKYDLEAGANDESIPPAKDRPFDPSPGRNRALLSPPWFTSLRHNDPARSA